MESIAVCISTYNRPEVFRNTIREWLRFMPPNASLFIVEDAHTECEPYTPYRDYAFTERAGIPRVKNKCIELAMSHKCEHIFLVDDDTYPLQSGWELPYIQSEFKHLCYTFAKPNGKIKDHKKHYLGNGCMMYIHRDVIDTIGGFDTTFGLGKYEHTQFSWRAYYAGLIPHPFMDVIGSDKLLYCLDQYKQVERTLTDKEQSELLKSGAEHFHRTKDLKINLPYK